MEPLHPFELKYHQTNHLEGYLAGYNYLAADSLYRSLGKSAELAGTEYQLQEQSHKGCMVVVRCYRLGR
jgi:hypothetical protein